MSTPALPVEPSSRMPATYIARQPILDADRKVFGYELLYRADAADEACTASPDIASASVFTDALLNLGFDTLTDGRKGFMNVTRGLLLNEAGSLTPPRQSVLELLETIEAEPAVIDACRALKSAGYTLALDDFVPMSGAERLLPYAKIVKVDVLATDAETRAKLAQRLLPRGITMLAEKVETAEMYEQSLADGYTLFQGYFFCRPKTLRSGPLPPSSIAHLQVLAAVNQPDVSVAIVEDVVKREASLSYKLLRCVNSAASGVHQEIHSIRQAILLLGIDRIRTWASVWAMAGINGRNTTEVVTIAVLRARCCELLGKVLGEDTGQELFLLGLCSLLDAMLGQPLASVVPGLPLSKETRNALLGQDNQARRVLDAVILQERGAWDRAEEAAFRAGLSSADLAVAHAEALRWGHALTQSGLMAPAH